MTNNTSSRAKKHRESTEPESYPWPKCSSSSSGGLVHICVTLSRWFSHKTAAFLTEQCTSPSLFSRFEVTLEDSNRSLKNYAFLYDAIFLHVYACAQITYQRNVIITQDCWIRNTVGELGVFEETLRFFSQYCIGSLWGETCCSIIDGKLQFKRASTLKKWVSSLPCFCAFCWGFFVSARECRDIVLEA